MRGVILAGLAIALLGASMMRLASHKTNEPRFTKDLRAPAMGLMGNNSTIVDEFANANGVADVAKILIEKYSPVLNKSLKAKYDTIAVDMPSSGGLKRFTMTPANLVRAFGVLAKTFLVPISETEQAGFVQRVTECHSKGVYHRGDTGKISKNADDGFYYGIQYVVAYCGVPDKVELAIYQATRSGNYKTELKEVTETVCKKDPKTGKKVCEEVTSMKEFPIEATPENQEIVERAVAANLYKSFLESFVPAF